MNESQNNAKPPDTWTPLEPDSHVCGTCMQMESEHQNPAAPYPSSIRLCPEKRDTLTAETTVTFSWLDRTKILFGWRLTVWAKVDTRRPVGDLVLKVSSAAKVWRPGPSQYVTQARRPDKIRQIR